MKIIHYVHALIGLNNGLDRYLSNFIKIIDFTEHIIIVPKTEYKIKNTDYLYNSKIHIIESLQEIPEILKKENCDFFITHYTGPESIKEKNSIGKNKEGFFSLNPNKNIFELFLNIDTHPFGYLYLNQNKKSFKNLLITHTEYQLPENADHNIFDGIIHVSYKAFENHKKNKTNHWVIYPCFIPEEVEKKNKILPRKNNKIRIGWLGRLSKFDSEIYNHIKNIYSHNEKIEFHFAGTGKLEINKKDIPKNFILWGNTDKNLFLNNIDVFLYPTNIDSFSLSLLEAAEKGLHCITSGVVYELANIIGADICYTKKDYIDSIENYIHLGEYFKQKRKNKIKKRAEKIFNSNVFKRNFENIFNYFLYST